MYYLKALRTLSNGKQTEVILTKLSEEQLYLLPIDHLSRTNHIALFDEHEKITLELLIKTLQEKNGYEVFRITSSYDSNDFAKLLENTEEKNIPISNFINYKKANYDFI